MAYPCFFEAFDLGFIGDRMILRILIELFFSHFYTLMFLRKRDYIIYTFLNTQTFDLGYPNIV